jgi:hypothetical protein
MAETMAFTPGCKQQLISSGEGTVIAISNGSAVSDGRLTPARHGSPVSHPPPLQISNEICSDNGGNNGFQERDETGDDGHRVSRWVATVNNNELTTRRRWIAYLLTAKS